MNTPQRVFAWRDADENQVRSFGVGTYVGDETPPDFPPDFKNPKIELDGGGVVWGMQCWWGPEERQDEKAAGREIVIVPIPVLT